ncbi:O-acetylhomoserine aminocarboxypropyltransferase/cysteine synthase family protein [Aquipuribacter sp. SD81]|uniref:O-acetylhomoserine aminocarboxypropyltransferase/cysteine synthase family protein n=1 Tax=Aquipuribacter sp. SD81 TaxID=3127703 RepID=UPI003017E2FE
MTVTDPWFDVLAPVPAHPLTAPTTGAPTHEALSGSETAPSDPWAPRGFATRQVHAGAEPDALTGARVAPVHVSAGFVFDDFEQARARFAGDEEGYTYSRVANPTCAALERRLAALEGGTDAVVVGSGQAAVTVALLGLLRAGDHLLSARSVYEGSRGLFTENFARLGIEVDLVDDHTDPEAWRRLVRPTTRAFFAESVPNPTNDLVDLRAVADVAHAAGVPFVVDNTLATPYLLRPLEHGADVVVHSASKFLSGHGATLGGVVVTGTGFDWAAREDRWEHLTAPSALLGGSSWVQRYGRRAYVEHARHVVAARLGPTLAPLNAWLLQQGVETLSLRVRQQTDNALVLARWLEAQPEVAHVAHAGLASSPSHDLARRYLPRGTGSVFAVTLAGGEPAARRFVDAVRLLSRMTHLGDVRSLVLHPASTTHAHRSPADRAAAGVHDGTLRLSVGIEDVEDLLDDLARGLAAVRAGDGATGVTGATATGA